jgi:preprotein translocase subunit SecG
MLLLNILYVLLAIAMIALILMQRGAGAQAGSGFGGGASSTVFGARGSANFLSKSTKWLAVVFFGLSLFMAWQATRDNRPAATPDAGGLMSELPVAPAPATGGAVPAAPAGGAIPVAPVQSGAVPAAPVAAPAPAVAPAPVTAAPQSTTAAQPAPTGG